MLQTLYKLQSFISRLVYLRGMLAAFALVIFISGDAFAQSKRDDAEQNTVVGAVNSIAALSQEWILLGVFFVIIGVQLIKYVVRLNRAAEATDSFYPGRNVDPGNSIRLRAERKVSSRRSSRTRKRSQNFRTKMIQSPISRNQTEDSLDGEIDILVFASAVQPDGKILIGGSFKSVLGSKRNNIARLNADGSLDAIFDPSADGSVHSIAVQADGKILIGGEFAFIGGQPRKNIARLEAITGAADSFNPNANAKIGTIAIQPDGEILVGGAFTKIGGQSRKFIARLDAVTGKADGFDPAADAKVNSIAIQTDGKILAGGDFKTIGGLCRKRIARLDQITGTADHFNPNANKNVSSIAVQADGKVLAGGAFTNIGGQACNRIARLDPLTGLADSLNLNADGDVYSIAIQADGKIIMGGAFAHIGGQSRNCIARIDATSGAADSFDPKTDGFYARSIASQPDGKILVSGRFTNGGGRAGNRFARFSNDTAALQKLVVTQKIITLICDGASPLFYRITFEQSTDGVNYTFLGSGTNDRSETAENKWILTGLNLAAGRSFSIRARGFYRSGQNNGSESITEIVENVFLSKDRT